MAKKKARLDSTYWRGALSILVFLVLWEIGSLSKIWIKWEAFEWLRTLLVAVRLQADLPALDRRRAGAHRGPRRLGRACSPTPGTGRAGT